VGQLTVVSASGRVRLEAAAAFLARWPAATEVLVVGATREAADDLCRQVAATRGATFGFHRFTLTQLASRIAAPARAARGATPATGLAADALATRALADLSRDGALRHLAPVAESPGLPRALAETLGELREAGVEPARLGALDGPAAADLGELGRRFDALLEDGGLADRAALLDTAAARLSAGDAGGLPAAPVLLLDVAIATAAERAFVSALVGRAPEVLATIPAGDSRTEALLPPSLAASIERRDASGVDALTRVGRNLFAAEVAMGPPDASVRFFSAPGEGREAVEVARRILEEASRGVRFDEMAIVVRAPESYWGPIEQALERATVPAWFSRGTRRPDPTGRAFLALLACAAEALSARSFAEYLSLGQVPRRDAAGRPDPPPAPMVVSNDPVLAQGQLSLFDLLTATPDNPGMVDSSQSTIPGLSTPPERTDVRAPWRWEALLVDAAVAAETGPSGRAARWRRRLDGLKAELELRLQELQSDEPESSKALAVGRDLAALDDLRSFALPLVDELAALPARATWGVWLDRLASLAPRALRHPARVLELLADLRPMAAVGPVTLAEVRRVLLPRLAQLDREPPRHRFGRVFVGTPDALRGRTFRVVFVVGLAERVFPQRSRQDPLLLDGPRRALAAGLATEDDRVAAERVRLRIAIGAATERCWLSYPRLDVGQGRARVPSFYALDVVRASTGVVPDYVRFERDTAMETGAWLLWPAPEIPAAAIDTWEHDLSVLGRLLKAPEKGAAHYLLRENAALARSLRTRWARWRKSWSPRDGLIGDSAATRAHLARERLTARPYSVSALQRFSACPYQFLLGAIYRFEPLEQPEAIVQLDPLTRGAIFHEIQRDVLRGLKDAGLLPIPPDRRSEAHAILDRVAREAFARHHDTLAPAIERVWDDETALMQGDLRVWLAALATSSAEWIPRYFELSFGLPIDHAHDPASRRQPVAIDGRFPMRGAIDLVEQHGAAGWLRVTDHKTGKNRTTRGLVVGGGSTLQPIIYTLVAEQMLGLPVHASRLSFCTTAGGFSEHPVSVRDEYRRFGVEVLEIIDRAVEHGALPQAPRKGACGWCDFKAVCGPHEERRAAHKRPDLPAL
jgi:hypothetical protein